MRVEDDNRRTRTVRHSCCSSGKRSIDQMVINSIADSYEYFRRTEQRGSTSARDMALSSLNLMSYIYEMDLVPSLFVVGYAGEHEMHKGQWKKEGKASFQFSIKPALVARLLGVGGSALSPERERPR